MSAATSAPRRLVRLWLGAAFVLCLFPLAPRLTRPLRDQLRVPATPVDGTDYERSRQWAFLEACRPYLPPDARFTVIAEDPKVEMAIYMMAIGRFPASYPMPHSYFLVPKPEEAARARYVLRYRLPDPEDPGLRLVARVAEGAVYEQTPKP